MEEKFHAFENITVPSIKAQHYRNLKWIIFYSPKMPVIYLKKLRAAVRGLQTDLIAIGNMKEANRRFSEYSKARAYITVRLDDDDGLHPEYFKRIQDKANHGAIFGTGRGYRLSRKNGQLVGCQDKYAPRFLSIGLAQVGNDVNKLGNHNLIHKRFPEASHIDGDMYLVFAGEATDTKRSERKDAKPFSVKAYLSGKDPFIK